MKKTWIAHRLRFKISKFWNSDSETVSSREAVPENSRDSCSSIFCFQLFSYSVFYLLFNISPPLSSNFIHKTLQTSLVWVRKQERWYKGYDRSLQNELDCQMYLLPPFHSLFSQFIKVDDHLDESTLLFSFKYVFWWEKRLVYVQVKRTRRIEKLTSFISWNQWDAEKEKKFEIYFFWITVFIDISPKPKFIQQMCNQYFSHWHDFKTEKFCYSVSENIYSN